MAYGILYDFLMGQSIEAYRYFGAHFLDKEIDGKKVSGVVFRLYAPLANDVSVIGEWNNWDVTRNKMEKIDSSGVFETFVPGLHNYQSYKYHFLNAKGEYVDKADPFAFFSELRPNTCSRLFDIENFIWHDETFLKKRDRGFDKPVSIYEIHLGSWKGLIDGRYPSYEEIADYLIPYLKENGFTHVEIMPICQYPFDGSWGYQATGFFSVDSRYGNPFQLMSFIDRMHQAGFSVILDFAPVHFANDKFALREFDGSCLYEYGDMKHTFSPWGSCYFDLGKDPVRSFLMSAMNYYLTYFHFDGIRVDAVSNIVYWEGNKSLGENYGATEFIKRLNGKLHLAHPSIIMIAEDSTDFTGVTKPLEYGGLGFDYKWDLGWMNDTLKYYSLDPIYKKYEHHDITFSMAYFFSENFLLPLSHDEVVHGKGTLINKMFGDYETKFALLRNLFTYQFAHPGKKLNFMGNEMASFDEWNETRSLPWNLLTYPKHDSMKRLVRDLNLIYQAEEAMHKEEYNPAHFEWMMVDNSDQSVFAFERDYGDSSLLFLFNMTPNFYPNYDVGVKKKGVWKEIFNSDKDVYGGNNQYNGLPLLAEDGAPEGRAYHISVKLASYGAMIFKLENPKKETKTHKKNTVTKKKKTTRKAKN
ncbi:MAG: 1,4-alpha-glucan branching protein GlgB [Mollicutes bacterium]|nr:1,4-alpha-glucan branching protein GlgB [Mollicutes bacterium]MDD7042791.1 1,4-alpha-glucan branching protein GlgB [Mollicutes bacterium]MDY6070478.1 1,4-alpha-glucan branching protein GlgB [Bacilli bacterium]